MRRLVLGAVLAALAMFVWGAAFWTTPIGRGAIRSGYDVEAARQALSANFPASGVYFVPDQQESDEGEFLRRHLAGPIAQVFVRREGVNPMAPSVFLAGYAHFFASALLAGFLLRIASPMLRGYGSRVGFVTLFGMAAAVFGHLGQPIWFYHPWRYHLMVAGSETFAWLLAGLVLAHFVRSEMRFT